MLSIFLLYQPFFIDLAEAIFVSMNPRMILWVRDDPAGFL